MRVSEWRTSVQLNSSPEETTYKFANYSDDSLCSAVVTSAPLMSSYPWVCTFTHTHMHTHSSGIYHSLERSCENKCTFLLRKQHRHCNVFETLVWTNVVNNGWRGRKGQLAMWKLKRQASWGNCLAHLFSAICLSLCLHVSYASMHHTAGMHVNE